MNRRLLSLTTILMFEDGATGASLRSHTSGAKAQSEIKPNTATLEETKCFDEQISTLLEDNGIPGGSFAVMRHGELAYTQGYGTRDAPFVSPETENRPFLPSTPSRIFSISKAITATTIVLLAQDGILGLDDLVFASGGALNPYIQRHNDNGSANVDPLLYNITIRQVLQHTAGFTPSLVADDPKSDPVLSSRFISKELGIPGPVTCGDLITYMVGVPLETPPGTMPEYSNFGYCVLEGVIEGVTGMRYEDVVSEWLLDPLDINKGEFYLPKSSRLEDSKPNEAEYHMQGDEVCEGPSVYPSEGGINVTCPYGALYNCESASAFGAWTASTRELIKLGKVLGPPHCHESECLIKEEWLREIEQKPAAWPKDTPFWVGLGYFIVPGNVKNETIWFHEASASGGMAFIIRTADEVYAATFNGNNGTGMADLESGQLKITTMAECVKDWPMEYSNTSAEAHGPLGVFSCATFRSFCHDPISLAVIAIVVSAFLSLAIVSLFQSVAPDESTMSSK